MGTPVRQTLHSHLMVQESVQFSPVTPQRFLSLTVSKLRLAGDVPGRGKQACWGNNFKNACYALVTEQV